MAGPDRRRIFWVVVPLLFAGAAALAVVVARQARQQVRIESDPIDMVDDELGYRLRPDLRGAQLVIPGRPVPPSFHLSFDARTAGKSSVRRIREFVVDTNSRGFRGPEFPATPAEGTVRVVCMGDSITFGWGVREAEGYVRVAEEEASRARAADRPRFEMINAGVPGYGLDVVLRYLERDIVALQPDLVTVCKLGNLRADDPLADFREKLAAVAALGREHGFAVAFLCPPRSTFDRWPLTPRFRDAMEAEAAEQGAIFVDFMTLFDQAAADRGLVVEVDGETQRLVHLDRGKRSVEVEVTYRKFGPDADPLAPELYEFMDHSDLAEALIYDDGHPDEEGHALMGEYLAARLLETETESETETETETESESESEFE